MVIRLVLPRTSAFDRINVRRLFLYLEKAISAVARDQLFEFNDEITRTNFVNAVEPFLREVQSNRGVQDFVVVCDETNNTAAVIDRNEFVADIYIKPSFALSTSSVSPSLLPALVFPLKKSSETFNLEV